MFYLAFISGQVFGGSFPGDKLWILYQQAQEEKVCPVAICKAAVNTHVFFLCFTEQQKKKKRTTLYLIVLSSSTNSTKKNAQATKEDIL